MLRSTAISVILLATCLSCSAPANRPIQTAEELRSAALAQAKQEDKRVFLLFVAPPYDWCRPFDEFHADPGVGRVIGRHFVIAKVDVIETPGGEQMYLGLGANRGAPAFTILDFKGMILADSGDADQNVGFPHEPDEIDRYVTAVRTGCPEMTDDEVAALRAKLQSMRAPSEHDK
jgi:hypothetical protein